MQLDLFDKSSGSLVMTKENDNNGWFALNNNFRIARLDEFHANHLTDDIDIFKNLLIENEEMYPDIQKWFDRKVIPGLRSQERTAFVGYLNEKPIVTAVVKKGKQAKFCHLRISDDFQNINLGELFFSLMALEARGFAEEIHFTLPESLWTSKSDFFKSFGFKEIEKAGTQYRNWDKELQCSAPFNTVWSAFLKKLPKLTEAFSISGFSMDNTLLLSLRPEYANMILKGKKNVEIRKKFSSRWLMHRVNLYSSFPECSIVGEALIRYICIGNPDNIWENYHDQIGCTKEEYDEYIGNANEIYALFLDEIKPYRDTIPISQLSYYLKKNLTPPQSYSVIKENTSWSNAVSIAALLHCNYKIPEHCFK